MDERNSLKHNDLRGMRKHPASAPYLVLSTQYGVLWIQGRPLPASNSLLAPLPY
jgi:hypothetical protein